MTEARRRIQLLVSELSERERGVLRGRYSQTRRWAQDRGVERLLPPPPPIEADATVGMREREIDERARRAARGASAAGKRSTARRGPRQPKGGADAG